MKTCRSILLILCVVFISFTKLYAQYTTYEFAQRDTCTLYLDLYRPTVESNNCCVLFIFGGGFIMGQRDIKEYQEFARQLNERGYTFVSIDYRLGLKGANTKGLHIISSLDKAIHIAVEDLFSATEYLIQNADNFGIDPGKIVLSGSSAGAITALQGDYELCNHTEYAKNLPSNFRFAGVMPFSGAIFSRNGAVKYADKPAPTLFFHGMEDKIVTYKSIRFGKLGFFGANPLVKRFEKFNYPYYVRRYVGHAHEIAAIMNREVETVDWFIQHYVLNKENLQIDATITNHDIKTFEWGKGRGKNLYN